MADRKKIIEEIMAGFQAMRNKIQTKILQSDSNNSVTHSQWFVLGIIEQNSNIGIKEISKMLGISSSAATQLVDGLVDNQYVERKSDPKDRRALHLKISLKGRKYITAKRKDYMKKTIKLFSVLSDKELSIYLTLHKKMLSHISNDNVL